MYLELNLQTADSKLNPFVKTHVHANKIAKLAYKFVATDVMFLIKTSASD